MTLDLRDDSSTRFEQLCSALDASGVVGTWDWDCVRDLATFDHGAADLLALDAGLAGRNLHWEAATLGIHPDDQDWLRTEFKRAVEAGGLFLAEYRVVTAGRGIRWLLSRGRTYQNTHGRPIRTRGILIDITESRDDRAGYLARTGERSQPPLDRAVALLLEAHEALGELGGEEARHLRLLLDVVLFEIGTRFARQARH